MQLRILFLGIKEPMRQCEKYIACFIRHLTSASVKALGIVSSSRPRSCSQYSNTMNTLHWWNICYKVCLLILIESCKRKETVSAIGPRIDHMGIWQINLIFEGELMG